MPRRRPPRELWRALRRQVWERDDGLCQYPYGQHPVALAEAHIDHIVSGKRGTNDLGNLRTLCRYHHVLRADHRHQGMIAQALTDGLIPTNWRALVWDDPGD
ncbi:MAG: HNH endonuclease [Chloroflexales bacterium]|nr:HNH endonuclease [Chloroflexales bacterium]